MLKGKTVVIGISGGIAVYKICEVVSKLKKLEIDVIVVMTKNATEFVSPLTFETLSKNPVITDMFINKKTWEVEHISLAKKSDLFVIAPATANIIAKFATGIADDFLTTTILATKKPILVAPAMNSGMFTNDIVQKNIIELKNRGMSILEPSTGMLACGDSGIGRLPEPDEIVSKIVNILQPTQDLKNKNILITCGATIEKLDDVRFITNFSSGKMGCAIAKNALERGANVTLILARHTAEVPTNLKIVNVGTTQEMYDAVIKEVANNDIIIKAAAPCDYRPKTFATSKIKTKTLTIDFEKNIDIAYEVGKIKGEKLLVVFSAETDHLIENATKKLHAKNADFIVANNINAVGAGFDINTNIVTLIDKFGVTESYDIMQKSKVAEIILDKVTSLLIRGKNDL